MKPIEKVSSKINLWTNRRFQEKLIKTVVYMLIFVGAIVFLIPFLSYLFIFVIIIIYQNKKDVKRIDLINYKSIKSVKCYIFLLEGCLP
ncbi:hypothetical protein ES705_28155 [subsurface metagenome]